MIGGMLNIRATGSYFRTGASMLLLAILSPFLEHDNPIIVSPLALSCPCVPWTRCPFGSTSTPEETGSGVTPRPSLLQRGADL